MKKIAESGGEAGQQPGPHFDQAWFYQLCELMITPQAPFVKRQVRKLLLLICGSKEQYRQLRDLHTLETRIKEVKVTVAKGGFDVCDLENSSVNLMYDTLIQLIEQLKSCVEVAESRTLNWQRFCMSDDTVLTFLLAVSYMVDNGKSQKYLSIILKTDPLFVQVWLLWFSSSSSPLSVLQPGQRSRPGPSQPARRKV